MHALKHLEYLFRHSVVYPALRIVFRNPRSEATIDLQRISKILILRYDRIGDMIVTTPLFRFLKETNPDLQIGVFASQSNAAIIRHNPHVNEIFVLESNWLALFREILRARREQYDVVLNFIFNRTTTGGLLANLIAPNGVKVGQGAEKYSFYFNRMLRLERDVHHMAEILAWYTYAVFGISILRDQLRFEIVVDEQARTIVNNFLDVNKLRRRHNAGAAGRRYVVFNLTATDKVRRLSKQQMIVVAKHLCDISDYAVVLVSDPSWTALRHEVAEAVPTCFEFPPTGSTGLREITSLIEGACGVITPDTSIIHFASATQTPVLGFFTSLQSPTEWLPFNVKHQIVRARSNEPVSAITEGTLKQAVDGFLNSLLIA